MINQSQIPSKTKDRNIRSIRGKSNIFNCSGELNKQVGDVIKSFISDFLDDVKTGFTTLNIQTNACKTTTTQTSSTILTLKDIRGEGFFSLRNTLVTDTKGVKTTEVSIFIKPNKHYDNDVAKIITKLLFIDNIEKVFDGSVPKWFNEMLKVTEID